MQSPCHLLGLSPSQWHCRDGPVLVRKTIAGAAGEAQGSTYLLMVLGVQLGEKSSPRGLGKCEPLVLLGLYPTSGHQHCPSFRGGSPAMSQCSGAQRALEHSCLLSYSFLLSINFFQVTLCPPLLAHSQLTGRKVEDFHENLDSLSCLSNSRIWISNLQYVYIYI